MASQEGLQPLPPAILSDRKRQTIEVGLETKVGTLDLRTAYDDLRPNITTYRLNSEGELVRLCLSKEEIKAYELSKYNPTEEEKAQVWMLYENELKDIKLPEGITWKDVIVGCHKDEWRARAHCYPNYPNGFWEPTAQPLNVTIAIYLSMKDPYLRINIRSWKSQYIGLQLIRKYLDFKNGVLGNIAIEEEAWLRAFVEAVNGSDSFTHRVTFVKMWKDSAWVTFPEPDIGLKKKFFTMKRRVKRQLYELVKRYSMGRYVVLPEEERQFITFVSRILNLEQMFTRFSLTAAPRELVMFPKRTGTQLARLQMQRDLVKDERIEEIKGILEGHLDFTLPKENTQVIKDITEAPKVQLPEVPNNILNLCASFMKLELGELDLDLRFEDWGSDGPLVFSELGPESEPESEPESGSDE